MEFEKICEIIGKQLDIDPKTITMESHLVEDLHADSLDVVELVMDLEQEFDTEIPDWSCPKCRPSAIFFVICRNKRKQASRTEPARNVCGFFGKKNRVC